MVAYEFLPALANPKDAASFHLGILPFFSAMRPVSEYGNVFEIYSTTNPFVSGFFFSIVFSVTLFSLSTMSGNWSWYPPLHLRREIK